MLLNHIPENFALFWKKFENENERRNSVQIEPSHSDVFSIIIKLRVFELLELQINKCSLKL
jgi:hypothetical protein